MKPTLKAEFKKILTVRSTYVISLLFLLLTCFLAFYIQGFKNAGEIQAMNPVAKLFVAGTITQIANTISVAGGLIALLLLAHEYRYNTIVYTLTASKSRSKVLASKIIAILAYVFVFSVIGSALALGLVWAGVAASGHVLPHQDINYLTFLAKSVFMAEAYAMAGLVFITLIRNQIGAIAALFILPNTVEGLLSLLLKKNSVYMPFTGLQQVVQPPVVNGIAAAHKARDIATGYISAPRGALVFLVYLVVAWLVAWYLFLRRDAN